MLEDYNNPQTETFEAPIMEQPKTNHLETIADTISKDPEVKNEVEAAQEEPSEEYHGIKTTLYRHPATGERYKIPTVFSPNPLARNVLSYLENTGFVHILSVGQSGCLPLDEYVYTPNGIIQVKDVYDGVPILGGYVGGKYIFEDDVYEVKIGHLKFKATGEHPIWISKTSLKDRNNDNDSWVRVDEIYKKFNNKRYGETNTWYAQALHHNNFEINDISIGEDLAKLLGYLCSDGTWSNTQSVKFTNTRNIFLEDVTNLALSLGSDLSIKTYDKGNGQDLLLTTTRAKHGNFLRNKLRELEIINRDTFGKLQLLKENELVEFIKGYFNGDGHVYANKNSTAVAIYFYVGIHKRQAYELQFMLWRLGISSQVFYKQRENGIKGCWTVRVSFQKSMKKILGMLEDKKYPERFRHALNNLSKMSPLDRHEESNSTWLPVNSIKKIGRQKVMAWQTLPTHEIISYEGLRTHNSGKTTWAKYLLHQLHELKTFQLHWFFRDEIQHLDKIIDRLQKGVSHAIVLDDASFTLDELPREKLSEIAKRLTYIRHEVKADVIIIMNIHYSKGIKKFFRSVPFTYLTSINMEEVNSFQDVFGGYSRYKLRDFAKYYQQMMLKKKWTLELDAWNQTIQTYHTNRPFRIGLANEVNYLHFFYYVKHGCNICDPEYETKRVVNTAQFVNTLAEKYNKDRARAMINLYGFAKHGKKTLDSKRQAIWNTISEIDRNNPVDWDDVIKYVKQHMNRKRARSYIKKKNYQKNLNDIKDNSISNEDEIVENDIESDFQKEIKKNFNEMMEQADKENIQYGDANYTESQSFGDDHQIDFGNGLKDTDGFSKEE